MTRPTLRASWASRTIAIFALALYGLAVALVAFWPSPVDQGARPLINRGLALLHRRGVPESFDYNALEFMANIAFFVPMGLIVVLLVGGRRWWLGGLVGMSGSVAVELGQHFFLPSRFATVDDVIANTAGAVVGSIVGVIALWMRRSSRVARRRARLQRRRSRDQVATGEGSVEAAGTLSDSRS
ncbi:VanZ family protein [Frigoribacterium sp. CFBP9030]|uniref:VanZ family protein n=1 Tax=Frigoribacterium sp. CFBP9030 TaxID=3096537 RepID=UPI002A6B8E22|nr:VanZ family protein [Frigoribacterium sp. CFBP9030]MDY0892255.1 VanZ family protein [Frigoribacterium sp. CFBP9030]